MKKLLLFMTLMFVMTNVIGCSQSRPVIIYNTFDELKKEENIEFGNFTNPLKFWIIKNL